MSDKQKELKKLLDGYFPDKKVARARDTLSFAQFIRDETKKEERQRIVINIKE